MAVLVPLKEYIFSVISELAPLLKLVGIVSIPAGEVGLTCAPITDISTSGASWYAVLSLMFLFMNK